MQGQHCGDWRDRSPFTGSQMEAVLPVKLAVKIDQQKVEGLPGAHNRG
jgi:hypothetical protein